MMHADATTFDVRSVERLRTAAASVAAQIIPTVGKRAVRMTSWRGTVIDGSGERVGQHVVETSGHSLIECLRMNPGERHLCMEEGTQSAWLYEILSPHVQVPGRLPTLRTVR